MSLVTFEPTHAPLSDYGRAHRSSGDYYLCTPANEGELRQALLEAAGAKLRVRVRGAGHSMNGSAVPRLGELLIDCRQLNSCRFLAPGTVTVGAGAAMWDVHRHLRDFGLELLVYNDGNAAASTVGGYVSAGGFGANSWKYGGFWETVASLDVLTIDGRALRLTPDDRLFRWLFGAMGQLAIVVGATLLTRAVGEEDYPLGHEGRVPESRHDWEQILWFTAFGPRRGWREAMAELDALAAAHTSPWAPRPTYAYSIPFRRFTPPLIHPACEDLVALGIWGEEPAGGFDDGEIREIDRGFAEWLAGRPQFRRYAQSELLRNDYDWRAHFGPDTYAAFSDLKRELDPDLRLGAGIFSSQPALSCRTET